ncbi:MAG: hypothetical protein K2Q15_07530 [Burkholderiales bacterium]|nr:hypothetical protein [Burkholderiales bacterium]
MRDSPAWDSLSCAAKKVSKEGRPTKHESPCAADNRVGGGRDRLAASLPGRNPAPFVPRSGVFQGDFKKPYATSVALMVLSAGLPNVIPPLQNKRVFFSSLFARGFFLPLEERRSEEQAGGVSARPV